jgi:CysZ protein
MLKPLTNPLISTTYPLRALQVFQANPPLRKYLVLPLGINVVVGLALYGLLLIPGWERIDRLLDGINQRWDQWVETLPAAWEFLAVIAIVATAIAKIILVVGLLLLVGFVLVQCGTVLGAPWYGQLSERMERLRTGRVEVVEVGILRDVGRAIAFELKKLTLAIPLGFLCFVLHFFPGVGSLLATILGLSLATTLICLDFLDPPLERRRMQFRRKLGLVLRHLPTTAPFGLVCLALVSVPVLNLVMVPLCIAAGTLLYCDRLRPWVEPQASPENQPNSSP